MTLTDADVREAAGRITAEKIRDPAYRATMRGALLDGGDLEKATRVSMPSGKDLTGMDAILVLSLRRSLAIALAELDAAKVGMS